MKNTNVFSCLMIFILLCGCDKPDRNQTEGKMPSELQVVLTNSERLEEINEWQEFRRESTESLLLAQEKLDILQGKVTSENTKQMIKLRRDFISTGYNFDKLQKKLLKQGVKFNFAIAHYTAADAIKNQSFRIAFDAKLTALHNDLDHLIKEN